MERRAELVHLLYIQPRKHQAESLLTSHLTTGNKLMDKDCVNNNAQANGSHEVHKVSCPGLPLIISMMDIGYFSCSSVGALAKKIFSSAICSAACTSGFRNL